MLIIVRCEKCGKEFEVDSAKEASDFRCPCEKCDFESDNTTEEKTGHTIKNKEEVMDCAGCSHKVQR